MAACYVPLWTYFARRFCELLDKCRKLVYVGSDDAVFGLRHASSFESSPESPRPAQAETFPCNGPDTRTALREVLEPNFKDKLHAQLHIIPV